ncbi:hypothetical protein V1478_003155, partial [Vespula squamosa]
AALSRRYIRPAEPGLSPDEQTDWDFVKKHPWRSRQDGFYRNNGVFDSLKMLNVGLPMARNRSCLKTLPTCSLEVSNYESWVE